jgi:hypothetical protein
MGRSGFFIGVIFSNAEERVPLPAVLAIKRRERKCSALLSVVQILVGTPLATADVHHINVERALRTAAPNGEPHGTGHPDALENVGQVRELAH